MYLEDKQISLGNPFEDIWLLNAYAMFVVVMRLLAKIERMMLT